MTTGRYEVQFHSHTWGGWRSIDTYDDARQARFDTQAQARTVLATIKARLPISARAYVQYRIYDRQMGRPLQ